MEDSNKMISEYVRRGLGGLGVCLGLWWIGMIGNPFLASFWRSEWEPFDLGFLLTIGPMMLAPGIFLVIHGVRLFRSFRESSLRWTTGILSIYGAFWLAARLLELFPNLHSSRIGDSVFLFASSLVVIPVHLFVVRSLLRYFTNEERSLASLLSRGVLFLMAWQLWLLLSSVFDKYAPVKEGFTHIYEEPWETLGLFVPIVIAVGSYCIFSSILTKAQGGNVKAVDTPIES